MTRVLFSSQISFKICGKQNSLTSLIGMFQSRSIITNKNDTDRKLKESRKILGVNEESTLQDVKDAFINLAKKYHPDSQLPTADPEKFSQIESAFRTLKESFDGSRDISEMSHILEKDYGIKHTVPQHRRYLNLEGVGFGTPSQREKQHNRYKVSKAVDNIYDYRVKKEENPKKGRETAIFKRDAAMAREYTGKTRQAIERLVEDLILESMKKGEFENLSGMGKPLKYKMENPYVDFTTQKMNEIMINNGFIPEWILLEKDLKWEKENLRKELEEIRANFKVAPLNAFEMMEWQTEVEKLRETTIKLNKKIDKFNMIVPILNKQQLHFQLAKEAQKALEKEPIKIIKTVENDQETKPNAHQNDNSNSSLLDMLWKIVP